MLCQKCGKNEAEVHFIQAVNGQKIEMLICRECAAGNAFAFSPISFASFFQSFFDTPETGSYTKPSVNGEKCSSCGISFEKIKSLGKVGCAQCYDVFKEQMHAVIKNVQAGDIHKGKCPKNAADILAKREITALRSSLLKAVEMEEYEEAAKIRDLIREIEGRRENG